MKKEIYTAKCPHRIRFGDPMYFEEFSGEKLASLVADYKPPLHFTARVVLEEYTLEDSSDEMARTMSIYMAPEKTMTTYLKGMGYEEQKLDEKLIGVDTACYIIDVDGSYKQINTGGDGCWGFCQELSRDYQNRRILDAIIIEILMPEFVDYDIMKQMAKCFFKNMHLIEEQDMEQQLEQ